MDNIKTNLLGNIYFRSTNGDTINTEKENPNAKHLIYKRPNIVSSEDEVNKVFCSDKENSLNFIFEKGSTQDFKFNFKGNTTHNLTKNETGLKLSPTKKKPISSLPTDEKQWKRQETKKTNPKSAHEKVPRVFNYVEIYKKKRQDLLEKQIDKEKKMRVFRSKPIPNFIRCNKAKDGIPENNLGKETKLENKERKSLSKRFETKTDPFDLQIEKRLTERKKFDESFQKQMEQQKQEEEEERARAVEEISKGLRKLAEFKASPNPFKKVDKVVPKNSHRN